ncbi:hypothetical protein F5880DRAFT_976584 [Lentinula raphanica]|nr:hypothetical protein F5880DRAFT_976584 [Lentinula raphanica]
MLQERKKKKSTTLRETRTFVGHDLSHLTKQRSRNFGPFSYLLFLVSGVRKRIEATSLHERGTTLPLFSTLIVYFTLPCSIYLKQIKNMCAKWLQSGTYMTASSHNVPQLYAPIRITKMSWIPYIKRHLTQSISCPRIKSSGSFLQSRWRSALSLLRTPMSSQIISEFSVLPTSFPAKLRVIPVTGAQRSTSKLCLPKQSCTVQILC